MVVFAVDTSSPHDGLRRWGAFQCIRRSLRVDHTHLQSHQRNDLTYVPAGTSRRVRREDAIWQWLSYKSWLASDAAVRSQADVLADRSKSSPLLSIVCMTTASLRATATAARLKPTRSLSLRPHLCRPLSAELRVRMTVAASKRSPRRWRSPRREMWPS